jgi:hypothetical protein
MPRVVHLVAAISSRHVPVGVERQRSRNVPSTDGAPNAEGRCVVAAMSRGEACPLAGFPAERSGTSRDLNGH